MELALDGREYARWTVTAQHDLSEAEVPQVQIKGPDDLVFGDWTNLIWLSEQVVKEPGKKWQRVAALLVRGPDITGSGLELAAGEHLTRCRVNDNPETVVRDTDSITVG